MTDIRRNDDIDLYKIYRVLREDWLWIVAITSAFAIFSVVAALMAAKVYRAEVVVAPVSDGNQSRAAMLAQQFGGLAGLAGIDVGGLSDSGGQISTPYLQSRALVSEFIERNRLIPMLFNDTSPDEMPSLWNATRVFMRDVRFINIDQGLITISVEWTDPVVAAQWANGLVALANEKLRERALEESERNIEYLNDRIAKTNVVGLQQAMFNLIENEMKTVMLAHASPDYAFAVVDPAVAPELRERPKRTLMVVVGTLLGGLLSLGVVGFRQFLRTQRRGRPTP